MRVFRLAALTALPLALSAPLSAQPPGQTIYVWSFNFSPRPIQLAAGRAVTLTFVNRSGSAHDFVAHTFFGTSRIIAGDASEGEIDLPPHATKSITLVPRLGTYHAHCSHFLHAQMGMTNQIIVS